MEQCRGQGRACRQRSVIAAGREASAATCTRCLTRALSHKAALRACVRVCSLLACRRPGGACANRSQHSAERRCWSARPTQPPADQGVRRRVAHAQAAVHAPAACRSLCACMPRTAADPALPAIIPPLMSPAGAAAACCRCLPAQWVYSLLSAALGRDLRPAAKPVQERSGGGTLTIMPYD